MYIYIWYNWLIYEQQIREGLFREWSEDRAGLSGEATKGQREDYFVRRPLPVEILH